MANHGFPFLQQLLRQLENKLSSESKYVAASRSADWPVSLSGHEQTTEATHRWTRKQKQVIQKKDINLVCISDAGH